MQRKTLLCVRIKYFRKYSLVLGDVFTWGCAEKLHKLGPCATGTFPHFSVCLTGILLVFLMFIVRFCFFNENIREPKPVLDLSFQTYYLYYFGLLSKSCCFPSCLVLARNPWLPGVRKHHNYLINIWSWPSCWPYYYCWEFKGREQKCTKKE